MAVRAQHFERRAVESAAATAALEVISTALKPLSLEQQRQILGVLTERHLGGKFAGIVHDAWQLAIDRAEGRA